MSPCANDALAAPRARHTTPSVTTPICQHADYADVGKQEFQSYL